MSNSINSAFRPVSLPTLPALPRMAKAPKPKVNCECGCGGLTASRFVPGHDSRLRGWMLRVNRGLMTLDEIYTHCSGNGEAASVASHLGEDWTAPETEAGDDS